jgi:hypothetical protein
MIPLSFKKFITKIRMQNDMMIRFSGVPTSRHEEALPPHFFGNLPPEKKLKTCLLELIFPQCMPLIFYLTSPPNFF